MGSSQPSLPPLVFRLIFLYFEPFAAVNGAIQALFYPTSLLPSLLPPNTSESITPVHLFLMTHVGSLWLFFGIVEGLVLRLTSDLKVWSAIMGAMLTSDLGFLYAPQRVKSGWDIYWRVDRWTLEDWINIGSSNLLLISRIAFLTWVWVSQKRSEPKEKKHTE